MEIDTDSGLARSALTMWRRRTLYPDHIGYIQERRNEQATRMQLGAVGAAAAMHALVCTTTHHKCRTVLILIRRENLSIFTKKMN